MIIDCWASFHSCSHLCNCIVDVILSCTTMTSSFAAKLMITEIVEGDHMSDYYFYVSVFKTVDRPKSLYSDLKLQNSRFIDMFWISLLRDNS
jgi:hypothetical protein